jgi:hypothetical protein
LHLEQCEFKTVDETGKGDKLFLSPVGVYFSQYKLSVGIIKKQFWNFSELQKTITDCAVILHILKFKQTVT